MQITDILGCSALAIIFTTYGFNPLNFKPFNCSKCMAFWIGLVYHLAFIGIDPVALLYASLSSVITIIYFKWITGI
jgi:hypothetical protein